MKDRTFLAINLNGFHSNQNGEARTETEILFISANSIEKAREYVHSEYPHIAWFVIPKAYCDKNIVYAESSVVKCV